MNLKPLSMMSVEELDIEAAKIRKQIADLEAKLVKIQKLKDEKKNK